MLMLEYKILGSTNPRHLRYRLSAWMQEYVNNALPNPPPSPPSEPDASIGQLDRLGELYNKDPPV